MKLMTKSIEKELARHPLYSQDGLGENAEVAVKYFNPCGAGTWLITEGEKQDDGDWLLFGYIDLGYGYEWGYVMLSEIEQTEGRAQILYGNKAYNIHLPIERDLYLRKHAKVKECA